MVLLLVILPINTGAENKKEKINEEIIYDVLVDRFNNGNPELGEQVDIDDDLAYHGGDIEGVNSRLDVLDSLGFTTILLSPIMENAEIGRASCRERVER